MASALDFQMPHHARMGRETEYGVGQLQDGKLPGGRAGHSEDGPKIFCPCEGCWPVVPTAASKTNSLVEPVRSFLCHHIRLHRGTVRRPSVCHVNLCAVTLTVSCRNEPCGRRTAAAGIFQNDSLICAARSLPQRRLQPGLPSRNPFFPANRFQRPWGKHPIERGGDSSYSQTVKIPHAFKKT